MFQNIFNLCISILLLLFSTATIVGADDFILCIEEDGTFHVDTSMHQKCSENINSDHTSICLDIHHDNCTDIHFESNQVKVINQVALKVIDLRRRSH